MRNLFVLACFVFALSLRTHAADEQTVTVKNVSIAKGDVSVKAELQGKTIHLWCSKRGPFCAEPASGEYSMVRAVTADDAIYQDCTDVVLFKSSGVTKEKVGVYCWLDSGDCYMSCGVPPNVETFPIPMRKAVALPAAEPAVSPIIQNELRVLVLDGRSGNPVSGHTVEIYSNESPWEAPALVIKGRTDRNGVFPTSAQLPKQIAVHVKGRFLCTGENHGTSVQRLDDILAVGVVESNSCNHKVLRSPEPGELTLFVRRQTLKEFLDIN